jgi:undecaprenyl-diphosphatase
MAGFITFFDDVEGHICLRINRLSRRAWIRRFFSLISKLGDGGFWALMATGLYFIRGSQALPLIVLMALTGLAGVVIYKQLKSRLVRERPYISHGEILCGTAPLDRYSFPSGHTLHAVSFSILLWSFEPALAFVAVPFALLVAASRVILGLHYPSDVIVGAAIGAALATASLALYWKV